MFIGVIIFLVGTNHYKEYDVKKGVSENDMSMTRIVMIILVPSIIAGVLGWLIKGVTDASNPGGNLFGSDSHWT